MHTATCQPRCNIAHERIALERRIIRKLLTVAKQDGWLPFAVNNGEEVIAAETVNAVLGEVFSVDESSIRFRSTTRNVRSFVAVFLGNGVDCLIDCGEMMGATYDTVSDWIERLPEYNRSY